MRDRLFLGTRKDDKTPIYYFTPSWACGWYWGFGYLGNSNEHYHLDSYKPLWNIKEDLDLNPAIEKNLWRFCELVQSAYTLKEAAEVFGRGGSHITSNPCESIIKVKKWTDHINKHQLPAIFKEIKLCFESTS